MLRTSLAMILLFAPPALAAQPEYKVEGRVLSPAGELLGAPSLTAVAHEPASVTLPTGEGRMLEFWALVKPTKDGACDKVMVRVALKGPGNRDKPGMVWTTEGWKSCGDEVQSFGTNGFAVTVQVKREVK